MAAFDRTLEVKLRYDKRQSCKSELKRSSQCRNVVGDSERWIRSGDNRERKRLSQPATPEHLRRKLHQNSKRSEKQNQEIEDEIAASKLNKTK